MSTPNIAFASVRLALLCGRFDYTDSGLLERTHLRFYTRATLLRLFHISGLHIAAEIHCLRNPFSMEVALDDLWFSPALLWRIDRDPLSRVYQFFYQLTSDDVERPITLEVGTRFTELPADFLRYKFRILTERMRSYLRKATGAR